MPYFPLFVNLEGKRVVVVGGGRVASRKVEKLLPFKPRIRVVAPEVTDYIQNLWEKGEVELLRRKLRMGDLRDAFMVVVAVDDTGLQRKINRYCLKKGIHCNAVDHPDFCTFLFPALIVRGELVIGISTSGKAPALSAGIRELLEGKLPEDVDKLLRELENMRKGLPPGKKRQEELSSFVRRKLGL
ncbi:MAG: bifunctional precorrin-2 dehydrogenase/sirohydrochlorin ferrochelatase [Aquificaceae bacterium]|nr:bifunctional precorrin-2 dehydrogenase/sirohydrochlorin ferrochelatase [Aquificaceae bacterium]MDW8033036.1 bifunctional precorrin-2 dehydrogenase/sirohydrochlorin ferrochelatase [Aquificaceae bacterium]MDW8295105.1 bifunctional precorrin-2 dehydrogenase/sirohydrochlorin ferrochelatase [Aquificaceae bacterium]